MLPIEILLLVGISISISSCKKDKVPAPEATSIELVSGGNQSGDAGNTLTNLIEVLVKDQNGNPFQGAKVSFSVTEGSTSHETTKTDASGKASVTWTLGLTEGIQTLIIAGFKADGTTALTCSPLSVNAIANLVASSIELVSGEDQTAGIETALTDPIKVLVKDQSGNAFKYATVNFAITEGSVSSTSILTDVNGIASVTWTLGSTEGIQTLTVTAFKADGTTALTGSPITINAIANAANSIELDSGGDQTGDVGLILANPIEVIVKDKDGNPYQGGLVNFAVTEGSVSSASEATDVTGKASVTWELGMSAGIQTLTITAFKADGTTPLAGSPILVTATAVTVPVTDFDGNVYQTLQLGNQIWMAENLKVTHYANGTEIPLVTEDALWDNLSSSDKAWCYYDNNSENGNIYGALYTWAAAMNGSASSNGIPSGVQGVCPDGWHLPSDNEWIQLEMYLGMSQAVAYTRGFRGTNEGSKLAGNASLWVEGDLKNDSEFGTSGFSVLPNGYRHNDGGFFGGIGEVTGLWSSTETTMENALRRALKYNLTQVSHHYGNKAFGRSVRCIKD